MHESLTRHPVLQLGRSLDLLFPYGLRSKYLMGGHQPIAGGSSADSYTFGGSPDTTIAAHRDTKSKLLEATSLMREMFVDNTVTRST